MEGKAPGSCSPSQNSGQTGMRESMSSNYGDLRNRLLDSHLEKLHVQQRGGRDAMKRTESVRGWRGSISSWVGHSRI